MIAAAADCAENGAPPPRELTLYWRCKRFGALPSPGGILDQPAGLLARMETAGTVYETMRAFLAARSKTEWRLDNPDGWRVICEVYRCRKTR